MDDKIYYVFPYFLTCWVRVDTRVVARVVASVRVVTRVRVVARVVARVGVDYRIGTNNYIEL